MITHVNFSVFWYEICFSDVEATFFLFLIYFSTELELDVIIFLGIPCIWTRQETAPDLWFYRHDNRFKEKPPYTAFVRIQTTRRVKGSELTYDTNK